MFPPLKGSIIREYAKKYDVGDLYEKLKEMEYKGNELDQMMRILKKDEYIKIKEKQSD